MSGWLFIIGLIHCFSISAVVTLWTNIGLGTAAFVFANFLLFLTNVLCKQLSASKL